jgi:hypothetical protein
LIARLGQLDVNLPSNKTGPSANHAQGGRYISIETNQFPINLQITKTEEGLHVRILERDEPEAFASARLTVKHDGGIDHLSKLREELAHRVRGYSSRETANEKLRCTLVLLAWDGPFRVNLTKCSNQNVTFNHGLGYEYNFAV